MKFALVLSIMILSRTVVYAESLKGMALEQGAKTISKVAKTTSGAFEKRILEALYKTESKAYIASLGRNGVREVRIDPRVLSKVPSPNGKITIRTGAMAEPHYDGSGEMIRYTLVNFEVPGNPERLAVLTSLNKRGLHAFEQGNSIFVTTKFERRHSIETFSSRVAEAIADTNAYLKREMMRQNRVNKPIRAAVTAGN